MNCPHCASTVTKERKVSLRDLAEMVLPPGIEFPQETVRGEARLAPWRAHQVRAKPGGQRGALLARG